MLCCALLIPLFLLFLQKIFGFGKLAWFYRLATSHPNLKPSVMARNRAFYSLVLRRRRMAEQQQSDKASAPSAQTPSKKPSKKS